MRKKGEFSWSQIGLIILAVVFLLILLAIIFLLRDKSDSLLETIKNFVRFGR